MEITADQRCCLQLGRERERAHEGPSEGPGPQAKQLALEFNFATWRPCTSGPLTGKVKFGGTEIVKSGFPWHAHCANETELLNVWFGIAGTALVCRLHSCVLLAMVPTVSKLPKLLAQLEARTVASRVKDRRVRAHGVLVQSFAICGMGGA